MPKNKRKVILLQKITFDMKNIERKNKNGRITPEEAKALASGCELAERLTATVADERRKTVEAIENIMMRLGEVKAETPDGRPVPADELDVLVFPAPALTAEFDDLPLQGYVSGVRFDGTDGHFVRFESFGSGAAPDKSTELTLWNIDNPEAVGRFILKYASPAGKP